MLIASLFTTGRRILWLRLDAVTFDVEGNCKSSEHTIKVIFL